MFKIHNFHATLDAEAAAQLVSWFGWLGWLAWLGWQLASLSVWLPVLNAVSSGRPMQLHKRQTKT